MVVLQLGKKPFLDREAMKGAEESAIWDWLTAFVVMLDKTLMATSFLSVSLFQWPLFPDSNCDRTNPLSAYIVQTAAGTVTASKYTIKRSCYNTVSNSVILRIVNSNLSFYFQIQIVTKQIPPSTA